MNYVRPIAQNCPSCKTSTQPRVSKYETKTEIVTEARWSCPQCGHFFQRSPIDSTPKSPVTATP